MPRSGKTTKGGENMKGKFLWEVTVAQWGTGNETTYLITSASQVKIDFSDLAKRALAVAAKDTSEWSSEHPQLWVKAIEEGGSIDA